MNISNEDAINRLIQGVNVNPGLICDGYHTFAELYNHRNRLYIALAQAVRRLGRHSVWKSKKHGDGSELGEWFILGIGTKYGNQITYHLPLRHWDECDFAVAVVTAPA